MTLTTAEYLARRATDRAALALAYESDKNNIIAAEAAAYAERLRLRLDKHAQRTTSVLANHDAETARSRLDREARDVRAAHLAAEAAREAAATPSPDAIAKSQEVFRAQAAVDIAKQKWSDCYKAVQNVMRSPTATHEMQVKCRDDFVAACDDVKAKADACSALIYTELRGAKARKAAAELGMSVAYIEAKQQEVLAALAKAGV